ncbi:unnamed protein product [Cunninghamella echinulata]
MYTNDNRPLRLQLWDTSGQERFRSLVPSYIRDSSVGIIVYDITNRDSFINTTKWINDVIAERGNDVILALVGNKVDSHDKRQISQEEAEKKAKQYNMIYLETSAKVGQNVKALFNKIGNSLPNLDDTFDKEGDVCKLNIHHHYHYIYIYIYISFLFFKKK